MVNRNIELARHYHEATKLTGQSASQSARGLDWESRPSLYKVYPGLELLWCV